MLTNNFEEKNLDFFFRNKLCRLLTAPDTTVGAMVAEFLFVLCKEKVGRFVKHTGYGKVCTKKN